MTSPNLIVHSAGEARRIPYPQHGRIVDDGPFDEVMARFAQDRHLGKEAATREAEAREAASR